MELIITEKNEVAKAVLDFRYPGKRTGSYWTCSKDRVIFATNGHMVRLPEPHEVNPDLKQWKEETIPFSTQPYIKVPIENRLNDYNVLMDLINKADSIVHAGDADDEGQLIVDELIKLSQFKGKVTRVKITELESESVNLAFENVSDNILHIARGQAAEGKGILNQLFGFNLTRIQTLVAQKQGYDGVLYVGSVQTPTQALVVRRDREIESHKKAYYYNILGKFNIDNIEFIANYVPDANNDPVDDKCRVSDKSFAVQLTEKVKNKPARVESLVTTQKRVPAPLPHNMASILAAATKKFKLTIEQIDTSLQSLRLNHNLITYSRSEVRYLSETIFQKAPLVLSSIAKNNNQLACMVEKSDPLFRSRAIDNTKAGAHHGIIPTTQVADLSKLSKIELDLYFFVCQSYISQFLPVHTFDHTKVTLDIDGLKFEATSKKITEIGWMSIYTDADLNETEEQERDPENASLEQITASLGHCLHAFVNDMETKPKSKYTVGTLLKDMNSIAKYVKDPKIKLLLQQKDKDNPELHGSIGTSSTQKEIVPEQFKKGMFIVDKKGYITSTQICRDLYDMLPEQMTNPDITALWYEQQELVAEGKLSLQKFIDDGYKLITEEVIRAKEQGVTLNIKFEACPICAKPLRRHNGKFGWYWYCSGFKDGCEARYKDEKGKPQLTPPVKTEAKVTGETCPLCNSDLIERAGKFGNFVTCSAYPKCTYTPPKVKVNLEEQKTGDKCPECKSDVIEKDGKFGKFITCSNYPKCKWTPPRTERKKAELTDKKCPICSDGTLVKRSGIKGEFLGCNRFPNCKHIEQI